jgi:RimJ/RimL family protein N-acetyltransferase
MELTDGSLVLRLPDARDTEAIRDACQDPEIPRWIPVIPQPYTDESAREFIAWSREGLERGNYSFVIIAAGTEELLGAIGMGVNGAMKIGHIGYWVAAPARGRGVASSALRLLSGWALDEGFGRVELITDPDNVASQRVAEKAGFTREGVMRSHTLHRDGRRRDAVLFSLLPGELV